MAYPAGMRPIPDPEAEMERLAALRKEPSALTPDQVRSLLAECVTVVKPGETLLIRVPDRWTSQMAAEAQRRIGEIIADRGIDLTVLLLPGEEFAVAKAAG